MAVLNGIEVGTVDPPATVVDADPAPRRDDAAPPDEQAPRRRGSATSGTPADERKCLVTGLIPVRFRITAVYRLRP